MAKAQTKSIPFSNQAVKVGDLWKWSTSDGSEWWYAEGRIGINTGTDALHGLVYCKNLEQAAIFSEGFAAGRTYQQRLKG